MPGEALGKRGQLDADPPATRWRYGRQPTIVKLSFAVAERRTAGALALMSTLVTAMGSVKLGRTADLEERGPSS
jgi:hypothetical protein